MSNVKSPWIVDLKASFQEGDYLYLVMEYCNGGTLTQCLEKYKTGFNEYLLECSKLVDNTFKNYYENIQNLINSLFS